MWVVVDDELFESASGDVITVAMLESLMQVVREKRDRLLARELRV